MSRLPKVFLSYSHDDQAHKEWVLQLAKDLRAAGVDAILDRWDLSPGMDIVQFMERGISDADRVILICSDGYVERANARQGSVGFEGLIITGELVSNVDTKKFIPVIRKSSSSGIPTFLGARFYIDFRGDEDYPRQLQALVREIHQLPALEKPPLGPPPASAAPGAFPATTTGPRGRLNPGEPGNRVFAESWFEGHRIRARAGLEKTGLSASMEVCFALANPLDKRPTELLDTVYKSLVHTFGWPLGIILVNREEFRPRPTQDGITAEVAIEDRASYDYWALRTSGDYYLLNSLFEDVREAKSIFLETRIVRTTEAFLLCDNLFRNLGLKDDTTVGIQIIHRGLKGRILTTASRDRFVIPETTQEETSESTRVMQLGDVRGRLVDNVVAVLEPMFMLFNFKEFQRSVYDDLVTKFAAGRVG